MNYINRLIERMNYLKDHPEDDKGGTRLNSNGKWVKCTELEAIDYELWFLLR